MIRKLGVFLLLTMCALPVYALITGIQNHTRGDVIALNTDEEAVRFCNFSLQVVVTPNHILCVYNGVVIKNEDGSY